MNERPADRYRQLWQSSSPPDLDAFLAQTGPVAPLELASILRRSGDALGEWLGDAGKTI